jgi:hypothetical protein
MIRMYCKNHHYPRKSLCENCNNLLEYALIRLEKCPQHHNKPTCAKCTIHCYKPDKREYVREVMRYSGPRMLLNHPYLAIMHVSDMLRKQKKVENRFTDSS